jgi:hypothetical protein
MQSIRPIMPISSHPFRARGVDSLCPLLLATSAGVLMAGGHLINQLSAWTHPILMFYSVLRRERCVLGGAKLRLPIMGGRRGFA